MAAAPTPSQTVGPFYGYALPFPDGENIAPVGHADTVTVHGVIYDGAGAPVPDALLEFWQQPPDGSRAGVPGSMRRNPVTGGFLGRDGLRFTGFGRVATDADGHYTVRTLPPAADIGYVSVIVFARGLLRHLHTRVYLAHLADLDADPLLATLDPVRRATLLAVPEAADVHRFDIRLQGDGTHEETVFLEFR